MTTVTTMQSAEFQRMCRDMSNIGSTIEIIRDKNILRLKCDGDFANQETAIECVEESPYIAGSYSLKYMNTFTKATSMCSSVQLMQEPDSKF